MKKLLKKSLVNIPDVCYTDVCKVEAREYTKVDELVNRLYELQSSMVKEALLLKNY